MIKELSEEMDKLVYLADNQQIGVTIRKPNPKALAVVHPDFDYAHACEQGCGRPATGISKIDGSLVCPDCYKNQGE